MSHKNMRELIENIELSFEDIGYIVGYASTLLMRGYENGSKNAMSKHETKLDEESPKNDDCLFCWCDTCGFLNDCGKRRPMISSGVPLPCTDCKPGDKFTPRAWIKGEECECDGYTLIEEYFEDDTIEERF